MLEVLCLGNAPEVEHQHGSMAKLQISRTMTFYKSLFSRNCKMDWQEVKEFALLYEPYLQQNWPQYVLEMQGVANGAGVSYTDILALNVRTEVAFGKFNDGCTAFSWKGDNTSILAQNWDWDIEQAENLICLKIKKPDGLSIQMITEAGIIGKIGLNSMGVGCTLNALKAHGTSYEKLPCHLALRTVMESASREAAVSTLEKSGVASACHILVADITGGTGLECSSEDLVRLEMSREGCSSIVAHTNHYVLQHKDGVVEVSDWLPDTRFRLDRINQLLDEVKEEEPSVDVAAALLKDEKEGDGAAICRSAKSATDNLATLFSITMDLGQNRAKVTIGRPASATEILILDP